MPGCYGPAWMGRWVGGRLFRRWDLFCTCLLCSVDGREKRTKRWRRGVWRELFLRKDFRFGAHPSCCDTGMTHRERIPPHEHLCSPTAISQAQFSRKRAQCVANRLHVDFDRPISMWPSSPKSTSHGHACVHIHSFPCARTLGITVHSACTRLCRSVGCLHMRFAQQGMDWLDAAVVPRTCKQNQKQTCLSQG